MYYDATLEKSEAFSITKVFGWLFMALGITAAVAFGLAWLLLSRIISEEGYTMLMIAAIILMFVETFVIHIRLARNKKSLLVPFIIYSASMGIMLSTLVAVINPLYIALAFGITALLFGVMALYGLLAKRDLSIMGAMAFSIFIGALLLSLANWILQSETIYWIVSFATFGAIMLFVSVDMWRIKKIAESGMGSSNLCLYCAFQLYVDFMYIFMRVIEFLARINSNR